MTEEEDEIQLVSRTEEDVEDGVIFVAKGSRGEDRDGPPCLKINYSDDDSEPRVQDERHIRHPGKLRMRLRKLRSSRTKRWCWWSTLAVLTILTIIFISVPLGLWSDRAKETCFDYESDDESSEEYPFLFLPQNGEFHLCEKGSAKIKATLGKYHKYMKEDHVNLYTYDNNTVLNITRLNENCLRVEWTGFSSTENPLVDCFEMEDDEYENLKWFGAHELYSQTWPMTNVNINMTPFLPHDYLADSYITFQSRNTFGPVLHPLWLTSNGVGILVDRITPLSVSINQSGDGELCLQAVPYALECIPKSFEETKLHYTVCVNSSIAETAKYFLREKIPHPIDVPEKKTFEDPIWSTWGAFKTNIDNNTIHNFLANIKKYNFSISQLELDDGYGKEGVYGDLSMKIDTKSLDVPLTAWVHPFVNPNAGAFMDKLDDDYFLPGKSKIEGDSVSLVKWWHKYGAIINYLDDRVAKTQRQALIKFMRDYRLQSLRFDAGEVTYLPKCVYTQNVVNPGDYATQYAAFAGNFTKDVSSRAQVRVGYFSQEQPLWVRMLDRSSTWDVENGLKSVLTAALTFGIAGYPFVLPGIIGGNGEDPAKSFTADPMLFIRWMQLSTFLPAMQFSFPPFHNSFTGVSPNVTIHALELVALHHRLADTMYDLALQAKETGYPIIRPLWWIDDSPTSISTDDQFLIGDDIMIAPILNQSASSRCVYFPDDVRWTRYGHGNTTYPYSGCQGTDLPCKNQGTCQFPVGRSTFLYFIRVTV
jgi:alpha-glucosidase (family GH31 glycosyl hydrolase)